MLIGLAVVVAVLIMLAVSGAFTSPFFEEKASFGAWGQNIRVLYEDGTNESLSVLMNRPLSTVTYGGKSIIGFDYNLAVKATGSDFTDATVTLGSYVLTVTISQVTPLLLKGTYPYTLISGANTIPLDSSFHSIGGIAVFPVKTKIDALGLAAGSYIIKFAPSGTVTFKGNPSGDVQTGSLPSAIAFTVVYAKGTLSIEVTGGATSY